MTEAHLPRLLYLADVPVESTYAGMVQLYRLLQTYPSDRISIFEGDIHKSLAERRLPGVMYKTVHVGNARLLRTRFYRWYSLWLSLRSVIRARKVSELLDGFEPQAVLTVAHGYLWVTAAEFARHHRLPLHLFVHDDAPLTVSMPNLFRDRVDRQFGHVYRTAASRLCVSSFMVEEYRRRYGAVGQLLYASRAHDAVVYHAPSARVGQNIATPVCGYAGSVNSPSYIDALRSIATVLLPLQGSLVVYGPFTDAKAKAAGLEAPNIRFAGLVPSNELIARLRDELDFLFVPMSFAACDRPNMETSFPSKLTDCTATGLPLLIYGPAYCSAVRWARENPGVAEVVDTEDVDRLRAAVERLTRNPEHRVTLATQALEAGQRFFAHCAAWKIFQDALRGSLVKDATEEGSLSQ